MSEYYVNIIAKRDENDGPYGSTKITHIGVYKDGRFVAWAKHTPGLVEYLHVACRIPVPAHILKWAGKEKQDESTL